jgi:hypothetical protein
MISQALIERLQEALHRQRHTLDMLAQELAKKGRTDLEDLSDVWQVSGFLGGAADALDSWKSGFPPE